MKPNIRDAIKLLRSNGYHVIKDNDMMQRAATECVAMAEKGEDRDCCGCPCSICVLEG